MWIRPVEFSMILLEENPAEIIALLVRINKRLKIKMDFYKTYWMLAVQRHTNSLLIKRKE